MIKKYNQYIKENKIVYNQDEIDPYGEEDWDNDEILTPVLKIAKKRGLPYDRMMTLDCSGQELTNLEGIETLTNLKELRCYKNNLTNLIGIENLKNLEYLSCWDNNLTSLEGIENLTNLKMLYCQINNLTSLEGIENLINLDFLSCWYNNFSGKYKQYLREYCKNENITLYI